MPRRHESQFVYEPQPVRLRTAASSFTTSTSRVPRSKRGAGPSASGACSGDSWWGMGSGVRARTGSRTRPQSEAAQRTSSLMSSASGRFDGLPRAPPRWSSAGVLFGLRDPRSDVVGSELAQRVRGRPARAACSSVTAALSSSTLVRGGEDLLGAGDSGRVQDPVALADAAQGPVLERARNENRVVGYAGRRFPRAACDVCCPRTFYARRAARRRNKDKERLLKLLPVIVGALLAGVVPRREPQRCPKKAVRGSTSTQLGGSCSAR